MRVFVRILMAGLSVFFLYAGASKLVDVAAFSVAIEQYRIVAQPFSWALALWLPWIECLAAIILWVPSWKKAALTILLVLLLVFEAARLGAYFRGLDISCGCLGGILETGVVVAFFRNLGLLMVTLFLLCPPRSTQ